MVCTVLGLPGLATTGAAAASAPPTGTVFVAQQGTNTGCGNGGGTGTSAQALGTVTAYPLSAAGDVAPRVTLAKDMDGPIALAFDSSGDLWAANSVNDTVLEFTKGELAQAHPAPSVTVSSDASHDLDQPDGLAFGPAGDLWVASNATNMLIEYTKAELAKSGSPVPRAIVPAPASATTSPAPQGLAIDHLGDLWVTSTDGDAFNVVAEFTQAELAKARPVPSVTISSDSSGSLNQPGVPVFAPSGALWVANATNNTVVEYTRSELTKSGSPAPYVTISANASLSNINGPNGLAFDPAGGHVGGQRQHRGGVQQGPAHQVGLPGSHPDDRRPQNGFGLSHFHCRLAVGARLYPGPARSGTNGARRSFPCRAPSLFSAGRLARRTVQNTLR